jgi:hypothetical protein
LRFFFDQHRNDFAFSWKSALAAHWASEMARGPVISFAEHGAGPEWTRTVLFFLAKTIALAKLQPLTLAASTVDHGIRRKLTMPALRKEIAIFLSHSPGDAEEESEDDTGSAGSR